MIFTLFILLIAVYSSFDEKKPPGEAVFLRFLGVTALLNLW